MSALKKLIFLTNRKRFAAKRLGVTFIVDQSNVLDRKIACFVKWEKKNLASMKKLIAEKSLTQFYDIGANFGYYSILLAKLNEIQSIVAFEPLKRNYYQLCGNIFINSFENKITPCKFALSDKNEQSEIWFNDRKTGLSTLDKDSQIPADHGYHDSEIIACKRFDDEYKESGTRALVKIDVEGFEKQVLNGMTEFLKNNKLVVFVEVHEDFDLIKSFFSDLGYKHLKEDADDYVFTNF